MPFINLKTRELRCFFISADCRLSLTKKEWLVTVLKNKEERIPFSWAEKCYLCPQSQRIRTNTYENLKKFLTKSRG